MEQTQILVVEDESIVAKDIQNSLQLLNYDVCAVVSSGEEAIEEVKKNNPDLVLMDIVLKSKMDGIEAAKEIRSSFNIPVVYLTAHADERTLERAKITEPYGYIIKPFEDRELRTAIEMALYKHRMEKRLKESEEWLATTLMSIGDAVIATDTQGLVKFMNPIAQNLTGWKQEDATGKPLRDVLNIVNETTGETIEDPVAKVIRDNVVVHLSHDTLLISKDGTQKLIADSSAPIKDDEGNIIGAVLAFRDVTAQRKMEEELQKSQRLESLGVLAGGIAHDFKNSLQAIMGYISVARLNISSLEKSKSKTEDEIIRSLTKAEKASLQATDLTQQLLTFSRGGDPIKETSSITEIIADSVEFALMGSNVKPEFSLPNDIWPVEVDKGQISRVIQNLIINADQAMPEGGIIKVSAENIAISAKHALPLKEGKYVKIEIEDDGVGIPKEYLAKIFDPYFSTKQKGKGSGLGLTICHYIIQKHDGYITAESELGVGTEFYIYLPASQKEIPEKRDSEEQLVLGKGKILIMDDEDSVRDVAGTMLNYIGYEVGFAEDGAEAIELYQQAQESDQPFDALIMDLTIPGGMGGEEAIRKLLEIDPNVKAIVSSGYSTDAIMSDFKQYGFSGVIAKPYSVEALSETVSKVMKEISE